MKLMIKFLSVAAITLALAACGQAPKEVNLSDEQDLRSYSVGAASLREARQLIDNVLEQYPDLDDAEKQSIMVVGFIDLLHLSPRAEVERFEFELENRGITEENMLTGLPEIMEYAPAEDDEVSEMLYTLGAYMAVQVLTVNDLLLEQEKGLTGPAVVAGFSDSVDGVSRLADEEIDEQWEIIRDILTQPRGEGSEPMVQNQAIGVQFQEQNAARDGVVVTESGLQYEVLQEGDGERPNAEDTVEVHYEGTLVSGEVFDSSYERGESISFPLNRVIAGWTEGLQLMQVGAKYRFVIPAELAYGATERANGLIQPYSTLVFEVELLGITRAE
ncbi:FKBP-type peptidyl-prolyl cis-trans isomerase [Idiomarina sp. A28L]|uniref:FKBP-type peptidyl-prolyl cis-trans isomerase n=1 Tax=Idiomarina sp. A28L TaxID=1036674 RepID=UPI0002138B15|nr:FKBP-type peptidyl-prolyl cis-trans isomerase [Idiomarina sp. A28L]EGN75344.1 FKBP-type peptidyl-prolyl cis-trans isomerase [Idiomarina sp. A28L]